MDVFVLVETEWYWTPKDQCVCQNWIILKQSVHLVIFLNWKFKKKIIEFWFLDNPQCKSTENACDRDPTLESCKFSETNCGDGFRCDGDRCIDKLDLCDGIAHCIDASDEHTDQCKSVKCSSNNFQCKITKQCIPKTWVCDNHFDCTDKSDEMENCDECAEFLCNNKVCILQSQLCDGVDNCG